MRPFLTALWEEVARPSSVTGPLLRSAFWRFASICALVAINCPFTHEYLGGVCGGAGKRVVSGCRDSGESLGGVCEWGFWMGWKGRFLAFCETKGGGFVVAKARGGRRSGMAVNQAY